MRQQWRPAAQRLGAQQVVVAGNEVTNGLGSDGRVAKSSRSDALFTPEPAISGGPNAKRKDITAALSGPLAAQALFPLADSKEMAGQSGENQIADLPTTLERWDAIIKERVLPNQKYVELFEKSFKEKSKHDRLLVS